MAYDEALADRVRDVLVGRDDLVERKMFGGLAFMVAGHMCCGILREELLVRLDPEQGERALEETHVRPMDFTGRPMTGFVLVHREGLEDARALGRWIDLALAYVGTLPPKRGS